MNIEAIRPSEGDDSSVRDSRGDYRVFGCRHDVYVEYSSWPGYLTGAGTACRTSQYVPARATPDRFPVTAFKESFEIHVQRLHSNRRSPEVLPETPSRRRGQCLVRSARSRSYWPEPELMRVCLARVERVPQGPEFPKSAKLCHGPDWRWKPKSHRGTRAKIVLPFASCYRILLTSSPNTTSPRLLPLPVRCV